jgi:hypothetical protein
MSPEIFRKALLATAKVACCAALVGCGSRPDTAASTGKGEPAPIVAPATKPDEPGKPAAPAPVTPEPAAKAGPTLQECGDHTTAVFTTKKEKEGPLTKECCQKIAEHMDKTPEAGTASWKERGECCELLEWRGSMACTPWGPPCPPPMGQA